MAQNRPESPASRNTLWLALLLAVLSVAFRSWNLNWGLPDLEDEAFPMKKAFEMCGWGTGQLRLDPETAGWPSLSFYVHMVWQFLQYGVGRLTGAFADHGDFFLQQMTWTPIAVWARALGVLAAGVVTFVGARLGGRLAGAVGALAVGAVLVASPLLTTHAQLISPDILLTMAAALALWHLVQVHDEGRLRDYLLAGLWIGLGASTKYTPVLLLPVLVLAHLLGPGRAGGVNITRALGDRRLLWALLVCALAFALTSPYLLLDMQTLGRDMQYQMGHMSEGHFGHATQAPGPLYYLRDVLGPGLGWPAFLLALAGLGAAAWLRRGAWLVILAAFVVFYVGMSFLQTRFDRYLLPGLLPLALGLAGGWLVLREVLENRLNNRQAVAGAAAALVLLTALPGAWSSAGDLQRKGRPGTLQLSRDWLLDLSKGQDLFVAMELYSPRLPRAKQLELRRADPAFAHLSEEQRRRWLDLQPAHVVYLPMYTTSSNHSDFYYNARHFLDYDFVVTSSFVRGRYEADPGRYPAQNRFYQTLDRLVPAVKVFAAGSDRRGPEIRLYRIDAQTRQKLAAELPALSQEDFRRAAATVVGTHFQDFVKTVAEHAALRGDSATAATYYQPLFETLPPEQRDPYLPVYARALALAGRLEEAVPLCRRWVQLDGRDPTPHGFLGAAHQAAGRLEEARAELLACVNLARGVPGQQQLLDWAQDRLRELPVSRE